MASVSNPKKRLATPCGYLPLQIRALFVTGATRTSGWLADAFAADSASEVLLTETAGMAEGLALLRDEIFDVVLVSHEDGLDSLGFLDALRGGGGDEQAIVVLGEPSEQEMAALCYEAGADAYVCLHTATTRALLWTVARAIERVCLTVENRRLKQAKGRQLQTEHEEATRLLSQQRAMIDAIVHAADDGTSKEVPSTRTEPEFSRLLTTQYHELLRTYIVMGVGNLVDEISQLVDQLVSSDLTPQQAVQLHLQVLEGLLNGLGNRSTRHAMSRADMLILEVMTSLAERFRHRLSVLRGSGKPADRLDSAA
jgi:DNA-binding NarL/FixJ family response regulator